MAVTRDVTLRNIVTQQERYEILDTGWPPIECTAESKGVDIRLDGRGIEFGRKTQLKREILLLVRGSVDIQGN